MSSTSNNSRIARNTLILYLRMFVTLIVGLYTSRVVLNTLGFSDYGLYNVVGGVVAMFGFLNGSLSTSTQRFLNFELGRGNEERLSLVFSTALLQHLLLVAVVIFLAETIGLWFVLEKMNIPTGRETATLFCYQFSVLSVCVNVVQLPFMSAIIAHEKMGVYAYVSMFDVFAKLFIVYLIQTSLAFDSLIFYSFLMLCVIFIDFLIYMGFSRRNFKEVKFSVRTDSGLFKEMMSFSGWNIIGMLASTMNNYGLNVLFNMFFGTVINAARGISYQVNGLVSQFSSNFQVAVKPQVVKYYANDQKELMNQLVFNSSKFSALLLLFVAIPLCLELDFLLSLWLGHYPAHTINMVRIVLLHSIVISMIGPILMALHATGKLKMVGITAGIFNLLLLPFNYILLTFGVTPEIAMLVNVAGSVIETGIELFWLKHYIGFPIKKFYLKVYGVVFILGILMFSLPAFIHYYFNWTNLVLRFFTVCVSSFFTSVIILYMFALPEKVKYKIICKSKLILK